MIRARRTRLLLLWALASSPTFAWAEEPAKTSADPAESAPSGPPAPARPAAPADPTRGTQLRALHEALAQDRLGSQTTLGTDDLKRRLEAAEVAQNGGRHQEAVQLLADVVEDPRFGSYAGLELGLAARAKLAESYGSLRVFEVARAYHRAILETPAAWSGVATYGRRSTQRLVEIALDRSAGGQNAGVLEAGLGDVAKVPSSAPADVRAEIDYLRGRFEEAKGNPDAGYAAYERVPETSRHWSQAMYLRGLIEVDRGRYKQSEELFCKVADPLRQSKTPPVVADARFYAVRDLARLALGRVAHEGSRFDDARYYYYLVPQDSNRLAEALYESATSRYEKKDYAQARELLDELEAMKRGPTPQHHRYEDEAQILDAYVDLGRCDFEAADAKLKRFLAEYDPVRNALRRTATSDAAALALVEKARTDSDRRQLSADEQKLAELLMVDPAFAEIARARRTLDEEDATRRNADAELGMLAAALQKPDALRPVPKEGELIPLGGSKDATLRLELAGLSRALSDLEASGARNQEAAAMRLELAALRARVGAPRHEVAAGQESAAAQTGKGLRAYVEQERALSQRLGAEMDPLRRELGGAELTLAKDALARLDQRLTRLLRRARLARIESVLGRKRALEVEIEAIQAGFLPRDAVDALGPERYLEENEEYWPFEGDDWPDEYVGTEGLK